MTLSPGFEAGEDRVSVAKRFAYCHRDLMGYIAFAFGCGDEDEGLSADQRDSENRNGGGGGMLHVMRALTNCSIAKTLGGVWNLSFGQDALQAIVHLGREEADRWT